MKNKKMLIRIAVSVLLFGILFSRFSVIGVIEQLKTLNFKIIPLVLLFLILNYVISAARWKSLLIFKNSEKISLAYLVNLYFIGAFFNNFMPTSIGGDSYKIYKLGGKIDSNSNAFTATFMERFTGVIALTFISVVSLVKLFGTMGILFFICFWFIIAAGVLFMRYVSKIEVKNSTLSKVIGILKKIIKSFEEYKNNKKAVFWAFVTSFVVQILAVFSQYFVFLALGVELPIFYSLFAFPFIFLAGYAIPSLNGLGVQDALYIQMFQTVGVSQEVALSASVLYHLFRLSVSLVGGLLYAFGKAK